MVFWTWTIMVRKKGYRFFLVVIDQFPKFGCTIRLKNQNAPKNTRSKKYSTLQKKQNSIESDDGQSIVKMFNNDFSEKNKNKKT